MGAMELEEKTVQIRDDFDPDKILASGQCFRPRKQAEGWYRFVSGRQLLYLRPLRSGTYTVRCEPGAWETFWHGYFDLGRSYAALRGKLDSRDDFLQRAMEYGRGIRVLRQDEWEMLVSFIISQRKSIPAIRRASCFRSGLASGWAAIAKGRCMRSRQQKRSAVPGSRRCRSAVLATAPATCCMRRSRRQRAHWT